MEKIAILQVTEKECNCSNDDCYHSAEFEQKFYTEFFDIEDKDLEKLQTAINKYGKYISDPRYVVVKSCKRSYLLSPDNFMKDIIGCVQKWEDEENQRSQRAKERKEKSAKTRTEKKKAKELKLLKELAEKHNIEVEGV